ncbi:MAG: hypothetical protein CEE38_13140 [Planctomycetes bacterium B3_Pla]|nr:MAG: hypothetical protein CEE38_13140 [Planctomycetes bacterium B3_Pla]
MIEFSPREKDVLRKLAEKKAEIAALPVHAQKREMWTRMNRLEVTKPMLWMNERPWHELGIYRQCECENEFACFIEQKLRKEIYQWEHMPLDNVVENRIECPMAVSDTGFGIEEVSEERHLNDGTIYSHGFIPQIRKPLDVEKIKDPVVTHDFEQTEARFDALNDAIGDIIPVRKRGVPHLWFAPWDELIRWWGVQEAMMDLVLRPQMVHDIMDRLVEAYLRRLDQYVELNVLSMNNDNHRVGSGAYGYSDELPAKDFDGEHVRPIDLWGNGAAQIFSGVSPEMHAEFALQYENRWMAWFGLNYYGCCEPLHHKLDLLKDVPNLRKISISPWADLDKAVEQMRGKYVISYKPNPAIFAQRDWDLAKAKADLQGALKKMEGCSVEIIAKDLSTIHNEPQRLWEWSRMASEVTSAGVYT